MDRIGVDQSWIVMESVSDTVDAVGGVDGVAQMYLDRTCLTDLETIEEWNYGQGRSSKDPGVFIWPMAFEASVGENRFDVEVEIHDLGYNGISCIITFGNSSTALLLA